MAYSEKEIVQAKEMIINSLSEGNSLKATLDNDKTLPSRPVVYQWLNEFHKEYDKEFVNNYARAREDSGDLDAEKLEGIAADVLAGVYEPAAARVAADILKWTAGVKKPKKYGNKIDHTTAGEKINSTPPTIIFLDDPQNDD